jgi:hypothetical protein
MVLRASSDLVIRTAAYVAFIKTRRTEKITATIQEIEYAYHDLIAELRVFPVSAQILLELWIYSKHGTYRFFRIRGPGLLRLTGTGYHSLRLERSQHRQFPKNYP